MTELLNLYYRAVGDLDYLGALALVFLAPALVVGALTYGYLNRFQLRERFARFVPALFAGGLGRARLLEPEAAEGFVARVAKPLHSVIVPTQESELRSLRLEMVQAGFRSRQAYRTYLGLKVLLGLLLPVAYYFTTFFYRLSSQVVLICASLAFVGFMAPTWVARYLTSKRKAEIARALPDALDLMVVCAESGLGLDMIIKRVGEEIRAISRHLSDEFLLTHLEIRAGRSRDEAFQNLTTRTGVAELDALMNVLRQASRFGTGVAQALRVHSDDLRVRRRQAAEEKAGKLMVKILFPLVCFIFPALFVVLLGPAAIRIAHNMLPALSRGGG